MINEITQFELKKSGKTKYNQFWGYGTLTSNLIHYTGIVQFEQEYQLTDGSIYEVKSIFLSLNKKGILQLTIALK